ncbi:MAG: PAS domain S-box protein [Thermoguttaceae bacterium]
MRSLHDELGEGILVVDLHGEHIVRANPAMCRMLGYDESEMLSLGFRHLAPPTLLPDALETFKALSQRRLTSAREVPLLRKDGDVVYSNITTAHLTYEDRPCMFGLFHDVTEQKRAAAALRESEAMLRGLFDNLPDLVLLVDQDFRIQYANHDQPTINREALVGSCGFDFIVEESQPVCRETLARTVDTGKPQTALACDVWGRWWSCRVVRLNDAGEAKRVMVIGQDVTQERAAAEAIKKEQRLLRQMLELQENERRLVACEIHDGFAQQITGALFRLQAFRETVARNSARAWKDFDLAGRMLARSIDEARRLISGLRPPILDELGIVEAVNYLVYERRLAGGTEIEFEHEVIGPRFAPTVENAVFRIVQESLTNACRHSKSRRVRVTLREEEGWIRIGVQDWGVGFNADSTPRDRFGLQGIRERVRLLDGHVTIESAPNAGTHLVAEIPVAGSNIDPPQA